MPRHILSERTYVVEGKDGLRVADLKKDKEGVFLLGGKGKEIDLELAKQLGLAKEEKAETKAGKKGEDK